MGSVIILPMRTKKLDGAIERKTNLTNCNDGNLKKYYINTPRSIRTHFNERLAHIK